jgi:hypothetical protein
VEAWGKRNTASTESWLMPACNPWGSAEFTFGGAWTHAEGATRFTEQVVQLKTLFRPYEPGGWGVGLAVGTLRHLQRETARGWPGDAYAYVPVSVAIGSDDLVLHVNAGAARHRDAGRTVATWGLGAEARLSERMSLISEAFAADRGRPFFQAGLRLSLVPSRLQLDATYGDRLAPDSRERWFALGLRFLSPPWLP